MLLFIIGLILFLGIHSLQLAAPGLRRSIIESRGEGAFKGIYSLISIAGFVLLLYGYGLYREDAPQWFAPIGWARGLSHLAIPVSLVLVVASQFPAGYIKRTVRHPMLLGVIIWGLVHLANNGDAASAILFGAFAIWAIIDFVSAMGRPSSPPAQVKVWPDIVSIAIAVVLTWALIAFAHEWLFGVAIV